MPADLGERGLLLTTGYCCSSLLQRESRDGRMPDDVLRSDLRQRFLDRSELFEQRSKVLRRYSNNNLRLDRPVPVHKPIPESNRIAPDDLTPGRLELGGDLTGGLAQYRQIPENRLTPKIVGIEVAGIAITDKFDDPRSRIDHLREE